MRFARDLQNDSWGLGPKCKPSAMPGGGGWKVKGGGFEGLDMKEAGGTVKNAWWGGIRVHSFSGLGGIRPGKGSCRKADFPAGGKEPKDHTWKLRAIGQGKTRRGFQTAKGGGRLASNRRPLGKNESNNHLVEIEND